MPRILLRWWKGIEPVEVDEILAMRGEITRNDEWEEFPKDALIVEDGVVLARKEDKFIVMGSVNSEYRFIYEFPGSLDKLREGRE